MSCSRQYTLHALPLAGLNPCHVLYPAVVMVLTVASSGLGLARHVLFLYGWQVVCLHRPH
jgi:hypothetical protein